MGRRFVTKAEIDALADQGVTTLEVDRGTTVTDLAVEHARSRGVAVVRVDAAPPPPVAGPPQTGARDTRAAVRSAVLAALGEAPPGLDEAIDRVLGSTPD